MAARHSVVRWGAAICILALAGCAGREAGPARGAGAGLLPGPVRWESDAAATVAPPDVVYLEEGDEIRGRLGGVTDGRLVFRSEEGESLDWDLGAVQRVSLGKARRFAGAGRIEEIDDPVLRQAWADAPAPEEFPDAGYAVLHTEATYLLEPSGASVRVDRMILKILKDRGKSAANVVVKYLGGEERPEIDYALTVAPDGTVVHLGDAAISDSAAHSEVPEYDRARLLKFALPQAEIGTVLDYRFIVRRESSDALHPFAGLEGFRSSEPIRAKVVRVVVPRGTRLNYAARKIPRGSFSRYRVGGDDVYQWRIEGQDAVVSEPMMPPSIDCLPVVAFSAGSTWADVVGAFAGAVDGSMAVADGLASYAAATVGDAEGDAAARALYERVVREVRQAPVPPSDYQYAPRPAADVLAKGVANAIDKPFLLYALMREAGLDVELVLVRNQNRGATFPSVPSVSQFEAALVLYRSPAGGLHTLSPGSDRVPFGVLPAAYQGTTWLRRQGRAPLGPSPLAGVEDEGRVLTFAMALDEEGTLEVSKRVRLRGQQAIAFRSLKESQDEEIRRQFQQAVSEVDPRAELGSYRLSDLGDLEAPVEYEITYRLPDYALRSGQRMLAFRIPELDYTAALVAKPERNFDLDWDTVLGMETSVELRLPPGFRVYYRPASVVTDSGWIRFEATFEEEDGVLRYADRYRRGELRRPAADYGDLRECLQVRARLSREYVVLERTGETPPAGGVPAS